MTETEPHIVSAVVGVYPDRGQVHTALGELLKADIPAADISLVGSENDVREARLGYSHPPSEARRGAAHAGAKQGGQFGAATGLLSGFLLFLIPGLGPFAAIGPLAGLLFGAGVGTIAGGPLGAIGFQDDVIAYRVLLEEGNLLVVVHCSTAGEEKHAREVLSKTNPRELHVVPYAG